MARSYHYVVCAETHFQTDMDGKEVSKVFHTKVEARNYILKQARADKEQLEKISNLHGIKSVSVANGKTTQTTTRFEIVPLTDGYRLYDKSEPYLYVDYTYKAV